MLITELFEFNWAKPDKRDHRTTDMSKIGNLLKDEILRLARREVRTGVRGMRKAAAQHRRDIAGLKRQVKALSHRLAQNEKQAVKALSASKVEEPGQSLRFSPKGLRSQRRRLGLSAPDYAKLVGVTPLSIYNWERGAARPRQDRLRVLASLRDLTKKGAQARLEELAKKPARRRRKS